MFDAASNHDPVVRPLADPARSLPGHRSTSRARYAIAAVVLALVGAGSVVYGLRYDGDSTPASSGRQRFCDVMSSPALGTGTTVRVHLRPGVDADAVAEVAEVLEARAEVRSIRPIDASETHQELAELFRNEAEGVETGQAEALPMAFEVELVDPSAANRTDFFNAVGENAGVFDVTSDGDLRVVDVIATPSSDRDSDIQLRAGLVEGVLRHLDRLDDLAEGAVPAEILQDLDTASESLIDREAGSVVDRRIEVNLAKARVVAYTDKTCNVRAVDPQESREAVATVDEDDQGN